MRTILENSINAENPSVYAGDILRFFTLSSHTAM